jgi:hypothetical protein
LVNLASDLKKKFPGFTKVVTGHSKGADPATVVSGLTGIKSVLFNPKSVNNKFLGNFEEISISGAEKTVNYFIQRGDVLQELRKITWYSPKGTGYLTGSKTLLDSKTYTVWGLVGKWLATKPLAKHGDIFKSLAK